MKKITISIVILVLVLALSQLSDATLVDAAKVGKKDKNTKFNSPNTASNAQNPKKKDKELKKKLKEVSEQQNKEAVKKAAQKNEQNQQAQKANKQKRAVESEPLQKIKIESVQPSPETAINPEQETIKTESVNISENTVNQEPEVKIQQQTVDEIGTAAKAQARSARKEAKAQRLYEKCKRVLEEFSPFRVSDNDTVSREEHDPCYLTGCAKSDYKRTHAKCFLNRNSMVAQQRVPKLKLHFDRKQHENTTVSCLAKLLLKNIENEINFNGLSTNSLSISISISTNNEGTLSISSNNSADVFSVQFSVTEKHLSTQQTDVNAHNESQNVVEPSSVPTA